MMQRLAAGERLLDLCREYGISRKTGSKFKARYEALGEAGLANQSRAPRVVPHRTAAVTVELILATRRAHPHYKGQFRLGDQTYCYPLTITDQYSRYLLACEGMAAISDEDARDVCADVFATHGLPRAIHSDNGAPFASLGLAGLTQLSAYWLRLGIVPERSRPGHPEDNVQHERMHRTLKLATARPARPNLLQQQECFDDFRGEFNHERPHAALEMRRPADVSAPSERRLPKELPPLTYPLHDDTVRVSRWGQIRIAGVGSVRLTKALAGYEVGIREEADGRWLVTFVNLDLGWVDHTKTITPLTN